MIIGALVVAAVFTMAGHAVADTWTSLKAASVGAWATAERLQGRRLSQRFADAMAQRRIERRAAATPAGRRRGDGTDGKDYRPGPGAYFGDLYHGFWERQIEKSEARRAAKGPVEYPGPLYERIKTHVSKIRARRGAKTAEEDAPDQPNAPTADTDTTGGEGPAEQAEDRDDIPDWVPPAQAAAYADYLAELDRRGELAGWRDQLGELSELERRGFWARVAASDPTDLEAGLRNQLRPHLDDGVVPEQGTDISTADPTEPAAPAEAAEPAETEPAPANTTDTAGPADAGPGELSDQAAADTGDDNTTSEEPPMTTPTTAVEVNNNTDLRMLFQANLEDARELLDLVAHMETDLNTLGYSGREASDYTSSARFDSAAAAAVLDILSMVTSATITTWAELADTVVHTSTTGLDSLQKWLDTEQVIAEQRVDGSTLAAAGA